MRQLDAIIVGGGPAGISAAIAFALAGRSVIVVERSEAAPDGPGETFHPGIETIFDQLGVGDAMRADATARQEAVIVERGRHQEVVPYGNGWRGFQIRRQRLNCNLAMRLENLGGEVSRGSAARKLQEAGDHHVVETDGGTLRSRWLIDASGMAGWLDRRKGVSMQAMSEPIGLRYGYEATARSDGTLPRLRLSDRQWTWRAALGDGETAWVECTQGRTRGTCGRSARGADGTWRLSQLPAGRRFFRIGDAACRIDPSHGHGVLRAMMSAIMSAHLAMESDAGLVSPERAASIYNDWIRYWFTADTQQLRAQVSGVSSGMISDQFPGI